MGEDVERIKRRTALLDYLRQHNWTGRPAGRFEFVGLCPLHKESLPSFYVNTRKNVFYCHGCGQGGDRFASSSYLVAYPSARALLISIPRSLQKLIPALCSSRPRRSISSNWITAPK